MKSSRGSAAEIAFLLLLFIALGVSVYLLYLNWPSDPVSFQFSDTNPETTDFVNYSSSKQFYANMRFPDKQISYRLESACEPEKRTEMKQAFSIVSQQTILEFYEAASEPDILILCSEVPPESETDGYFVAGEGGPTEVINTTLYGVILSGKISFFREETCDTPNIALHELLHVFGFDHNDNPGSILFPTLDCEQTIDDSIIEDINRLYSIQSAPDLKVSTVDATKSGRYLNFDIEVVNQGLIEANNVKLHVYAGNTFVKDFDLDDMSVGITKILEVENLKISRSAETITFIVDEENKIDEIFETNNEVELVLASS